MNTGEILTRVRRKWNKESQEAEPWGAQGRLLQLLARGRAPQAELLGPRAQARPPRALCRGLWLARFRGAASLMAKGLGSWSL